jgi:hypothetical protein
MNKKILLIGVAACLPLMAAADDNLKLDKQLNGLDITTAIEGSTDSGGGQGASSGPAALKITNNGDVAAKCLIKPDPAEAAQGNSPSMTIEPGKSAVLPVRGKYSGAPISATLVCNPA